MPVGAEAWGTIRTMLSLIVKTSCCVAPFCTVSPFLISKKLLISNDPVNSWKSSGLKVNLLYVFTLSPPTKNPKCEPSAAALPMRKLVLP